MYNGSYAVASMFIFHFNHRLRRILFLASDGAGGFRVRVPVRGRNQVRLIERTWREGCRGSGSRET